MELILDILYIYVAIYSIYFLALAIRNLSDKPFRLEKKYSQYEEKDNLAVVIYARNNKITLDNLIKELKMQDYPINNFRVFVILDNCSDGSEQLFGADDFINLINITDVGTVGKDQAVSMLIERLSKDQTIDSYVFIDADRSIPSNFLTSINSGLVNNNVLCGETLIITDNLSPIDKIKAAYQKYHMNFMRKARSLFGLAATADSGVFVIKKDIVVDEASIDVRLTNQPNSDGTTGAPSLYANIPIVNIKNDVKGEKMREAEESKKQNEEKEKVEENQKAEEKNENKPENESEAKNEEVKSVSENAQKSDDSVNTESTKDNNNVEENK